MSASFLIDELVMLTTDDADRAADAAQGYHFELLGDDWEMTSAEQAIEAIQSQLFDGEAITTGSYGNMEAQVPIAVVGTDSANLARGCAELVRVSRRPGMREATYIAPDGASPATVFDVLHVKPEMQFGDLEEVKNRRGYMLTLTCKPFPRSDTEVSTVGEEVSAPSYTLVDAVSTTTAWSTQDPLRTDTPAGRAWAPSRYNIATNGLVSDTVRTQGWSKSLGATSISWSTAPSGTGGFPHGHMSVSGKPTSSTYRVNAASPRWRLRGTGALRLRMRIGSAYSTTLGSIYRWYNKSGSQIGDPHFISEISNPAGDTQVISATLTPPSGAVMVGVFPYARFTSGANGKNTRTFTVNEVYLGPDGSSFWGATAPGASTAYDWTGTPFNSDSVELTPASKTSPSGQVSVTGYVRTAAGLELPLARTGAITPTTDSPFIVITGTLSPVLASPKLILRTSLNVNGSTPELFTYASDGSFKAFYRVAAGEVSSICLSLASTAMTTATLSITQVDLSTNIPAIGTGRQGKFSLDVQGTMPAEASLQVANTGGVGGNVLIHTAPGNPNWVPALSPSLVASGTADGTTISNKKFTVPTSQPSGPTWKVPHLGLVDSTYALYAKLSGSGLTSGAAYTFSVYQQTSPDNGTGYFGENTTTTGKVLASSTTFSGFAQIATLRLPEVGLSNNPTGIEGLRLWVSGGTWVLDEAWLFDLVNGQISHLRMPSTTYPNVTVRAASPDRPQQQFLVDNGDGTIRELDKSVMVWGNHRLDPADGADVFAICDAGTPALSVSASYFPRWDMFAAPLDADDEAI